MSLKSPFGHDIWPKLIGNEGRRRPAARRWPASEQADEPRRSGWTQGGRGEPGAADSTGGLGLRRGATTRHALHVLRYARTTLLGSSNGCGGADNGRNGGTARREVVLAVDASTRAGIRIARTRVGGRAVAGRPDATGGNQREAANSTGGTAVQQFERRTDATGFGDTRRAVGTGHLF